jgi:hypothetical protein
MFDGIEVELKRGQFITGRKSLAKALRTTEQKIRSRIALLEKHNQIVLKSTNKYSIITVVKYDHYQDGPKKTTNKQPTDNQQITTNNKVNKGDKVLEETSSSLLNLKDKQKASMGWGNNRGEEDEGVVDYDGDGSMKSTAPVSKKKYPNALAVYKVFLEVLGKLPANWKVNKTQLQCAENLFEERGLEKVRSALQFYQEHQEEEFCPQITQPSDLDAKWTKLGEYKLKQK